MNLIHKINLDMENLLQVFQCQEMNPCYRPILDSIISLVPQMLYNKENHILIKEMKVNIKNRL